MKTYVMLIIAMFGIAYVMQGGSEEGSDNLAQTQSRIQAAADTQKAKNAGSFEVAKGKSERANQ